MCATLAGAPAQPDPDTGFMVRIFSGKGEFTMFPKPLDKVQDLIISQRRE
jgi:hypothetical protein